MIGKPHPVTEEIARMGQEDQDMIDDFLLELNVRGLSLGGTFLEHVVERAVQGAEGTNKKAIVKLQATEIRNMAERWSRGDDAVWAEIKTSRQ